MLGVVLGTVVATDSYFGKIVTKCLLNRNSDKIFYVSTDKIFYVWLYFKYLRLLIIY